jgi:hypothetical protein
MSLTNYASLIMIAGYQGLCYNAASFATESGYHST